MMKRLILSMFVTGLCVFSGISTASQPKPETSLKTITVDTLRQKENKENAELQNNENACPRQSCNCIKRSFDLAKYGTKCALFGVVAAVVCCQSILDTDYNFARRAINNAHHRLFGDDHKQ